MKYVGSIFISSCCEYRMDCVKGHIQLENLFWYAQMARKYCAKVAQWIILSSSRFILFIIRSCQIKQNCLYFFTADNASRS